MGDRLLNPEETRGRLRYSMAQVYAISSQGKIAKYKLGNRLFFKEPDVEAFIEAHRVERRELVDA